MSNEPENGGDAERDIPIVVTGGSVMIEHADNFVDNGSGGGRWKRRHPDGNKKIRSIVIKDEHGNPVHTYTPSANGRCSVEITYS